MLNKIEALRKQPKHIRDRYAFWIAIFLTCFVVAVWALTLPSRFVQEEPTQDVVSEEDSSFGELFGSVFNQAAERFKDLQGPVATSTETTPSNQLDFEALLASSTLEAELDAELTSTTTATTSATSSQATSTPVVE
jgi:hypothetical protein